MIEPISNSRVKNVRRICSNLFLNKKMLENEKSKIIPMSIASGSIYSPVLNCNAVNEIVSVSLKKETKGKKNVCTMSKTIINK